MYQITDWCRHFISLQVKPGAAVSTPPWETGMTRCCSAGVRAGPAGCSLDIQPQALKNTKKRLSEAGVPDNCRLILDSHSHMEQYADAGTISCITFNLGYLPGGDHSLATRADTTLSAVRQGLTLLQKDGLMVLCIYSGGDTGFEEREALLPFLKALDPQKYLVILSSYYNRPNHPPMPVLIRRLSGL